MRWTVAFFVLALALGGCAEVPIQTPPVGATAFTLSGRIAVRHGEQGFSGGVRWAHGQTTDEIFLTSPLGQTVARISGDREGYRLATSEGKLFSAPDAETLTRNALGWDFPLRGLIYWVGAKNDPERNAVIDVDGEGRVERVRQDGWDIAYARYRPVSGRSLPGLITLRRDEVEIKLAIDDWRVAE